MSNGAVAKVMKAILEEHPDIKGIVTSSDFVAIPALKVVQEQGVDVSVMGPGGLVEMLQYVKEGIVPITISQTPYEMGYSSVETSAKVANGEEVNKEIYTAIDIVTIGNAQQRLEFYRESIGRQVSYNISRRYVSILSKVGGYPRLFFCLKKHVV